MRYERVYEALMCKAVARGAPSGYAERHHIKPKSLFPDLRHDPDNIVLLTAREHFVAHLLLAKMYGGVMSFAANAMSLNGRYGARRYSWLREEAAAFLSESRSGSGNPMFGRKASKESTDRRIASMLANRNGGPGPLKGRPISQLHRDRISAHMREHGAYWSGRTHSEETKRRISETKKGMRLTVEGRKLDDERRRHLSEMNMGKVMPDDVRRRISSTLKGRPKPLRSEDHVRNLTEANRRNGQAARERNADTPPISASMREIYAALSERDDLSCTDIAAGTSMAFGSINVALRKLESLLWVSVSWRRPPTTRVGSGSGRSERRHYTLTPLGVAMLSS